VVAGALPSAPVQPLVVPPPPPPPQERSLYEAIRNKEGEQAGEFMWASLDIKQRGFLQSHLQDAYKAKRALISTVFSTHPKYLVNCLVPAAFATLDLLKKKEDWPGTNTGTPLLFTGLQH
jgi:hypothetical protein